jgi:hypothetical protein
MKNGMFGSVKYVLFDSSATNRVDECMIVLPEDKLVYSSVASLPVGTIEIIVAEDPKDNKTCAFVELTNVPGDIPAKLTLKTNLAVSLKMNNY